MVLASIYLSIIINWFIEIFQEMITNHRSHNIVYILLRYKSRSFVYYDETIRSTKKLNHIVTDSPLYLILELRLPLL